MEQRRKPRFETNLPVHVTILDDREVRQEARVKNLAQGGFGLETAGSVGVGTLLKIELRDSVLLGTVKHCRVHGSRCVLGVELEVMFPAEEFAELVQNCREQGESWRPEAPETPQSEHTPVPG